MNQHLYLYLKTNDLLPVDASAGFEEGNKETKSAACKLEFSAKITPLVKK